MKISPLLEKLAGNAAVPVAAAVDPIGPFCCCCCCCGALGIVANPAIEEPNCGCCCCCGICCICWGCCYPGLPVLAGGGGRKGAAPKSPDCAWFLGAVLMIACGYVLCWGCDCGGGGCCCCCIMLPPICEGICIYRIS